MHGGGVGGSAGPEETKKWYKELWCIARYAHLAVHHVLLLQLLLMVCFYFLCAWCMWLE